MKFRSKFVAAIMMVVAAAGPLAANPFRYNNGAYCGECTDGVYIIWVEWLGHSTTPSFSHAYKWYDGQQGGFSRGVTADDFSILVIDQWNDTEGAYGHVAFVHRAYDWGDGWSILSTYHFNWSPSTRGDCDAQHQHFWLAYHEPSQQTWFYMNGRWTQSYPVRGFVYSDKY